MNRILAALLLAASAGVAHAQAWPSHALKMVVPFPPGGGTDLTARSVAAKLAEALGQPVVVENRGGAGGTIGSDAVAKAAPDGYTIGIATSSTHPGALVLQKNVPYDPLKSFAPITMIGNTSFVLLGSPALPANSIAEMVAYAKANPGKLNYGSAGNGSSSHLAVELFKSMADIRMDHIPYKGTGPLITDMLAGQIGVTIASAVPLAPHVRSGKLRGLGVTGPKRSPAFPTIPAIAETVKGYEVINWFGIFAPAGTPKVLTARINAVLNEALHAPELVKMLQAQGAEAVGGSAEEFERVVRADYAKWGRVVKESGARVD